MKLSTSIKMSPRNLKQTFEKICLLSLTTPRFRKQLVEKGGKNIVDCLSECCVNVIKDNVSLTSKKKSLLAKNKRKMKIDARKKETIVKKRRLSKQENFLVLFKSSGRFSGKFIATLIWNIQEK